MEIIGTAAKSKFSSVLLGQQLRFAEMAFDAPPIAFGNLVLGERHQQAGRRPAFLVRALGELLPQVFDGRQAQLIQQQLRRVASMLSLMRFSDARVVQRLVVD